MKRTYAWEGRGRMPHFQKRKSNRAEFGVPNGIRTHVTAVKGQCPRPLDDGDKPR